jgi:hypothetical protein
MDEAITTARDHGPSLSCAPFHDRIDHHPNAGEHEPPHADRLHPVSVHQVAREETALHRFSSRTTTYCHRSLSFSWSTAGDESSDAGHLLRHGWASLRKSSFDDVLAALHRGDMTANEMLTAHRND